MHVPFLLHTTDLGGGSRCNGSLSADSFGVFSITTNQNRPGCERQEARGRLSSTVHCVECQCASSIRHRLFTLATRHKMQPQDWVPEAQAFLPDAKGYQPLDNSGGDGGQNTRKTMRWAATCVLALTALAAVMPKHLNVSVNFYGGADDSAAQLDKFAKSAPFSFSVRSQGYDDAPGLGYSFIDQSRFVEPYRAATFQVTGEVKNCSWSTSKDYPEGVYDDFLVSEDMGSLYASGSGVKAFVVDFRSPGTYSVSLTCNMEDGTTAELLDTVNCYYVRRELRQLSLVDREAFLEGFMTMYKTGRAEGAKKYGKHYKPLSEFVNEHLTAAGQRRVDHIHDGIGLVTQHTAMTLEFELSLQAISPRLAVPYWDYTYDSAKIGAHEPDEMKTSIAMLFHASDLFTKTFFGETNAEVAHVTEGRFAHVRVSRDYSAATNSPRGFLRAPWNVNPSSYVTRYHSILGSDEVIPEYQDLVWPTCASHLGLSTSLRYSSWYSWAWASGYMPHGPVHSWVGGVGGGNAEDVYNNMLDEGLITDAQARQLKVYAFERLKNLWRSETIETPKYCSEDAPVSECGWTCTEDITNDAMAQVAMEQAGIYADEIGVTKFEKILTRSLCEVTYWPGDMFEAGSPIEASFWPIHPTMDRLLQYKDLVQPFQDKTYDGYNESGYACLSSMDGCLGHNAEDLTYWQSVHLAPDGTYSKSYRTNEEVRNAILPTGEYQMPYIYNSFEWKHCDDAGKVFPKVNHVGHKQIKRSDDDDSTESANARAVSSAPH